MEGTNPKRIDLDSLMIEFGEMPLDEIKEVSRKLFSRIFLEDKTKGCIYTHDDESVQFYANHFDHAFFQSPKKNEIDIGRVKRIRWIKFFVSGLIPNSECWEVNENGRKKRFYLSFEKTYVVFLHIKKTGGWGFKTAFPTTQKYLANCVKGATLIKRFK